MGFDSWLGSADIIRIAGVLQSTVGTAAEHGSMPTALARRWTMR